MGLPGMDLQRRFDGFSSRQLVGRARRCPAAVRLGLVVGLGLAATDFSARAQPSDSAEAPRPFTMAGEEATPLGSPDGAHAVNPAVSPALAPPPDENLAAEEPGPRWRNLDHALLISGVVLASLLLGALLIEHRRRRAAERHWQESEGRMALVASSVDLGLWRWQAGGDHLWADENCRRLLGFTVDAPLKLRTLLKAIHPEDRASAWREIEDAMRSGRRYWMKHRAPMADGSSRWFLASGSGMLDEHGNPSRMTGIVVDITERRRAEREVEKQRDELAHLARVAILGELSGALAHELNQPLTAILSNAQAALRLMEDASVDLDEIREILKDIVSDDSRAGEVIRRLRTLLKKGAVEPRAIDPGNMLLEVAELMRGDLAQRRVRLILRLAPQLPTVSGDPVQLQQVLINFILNGCEAMQQKRPQERILTLASDLDAEGGLRISVADQGVGIAAEARDRLFEPFYTTKPNGLGLGLSISRSILSAHGGRLWAENNAKGGATFVFTLPARPQTRSGVAA
jgi:PAS domain S-box-containing protein